MDIETVLTLQHVTWIIRDFFELPQEEEFLDSPEFLFHGDRFGIRLYPKDNRDETAFHVRRLSVNFPDNKVSCRIGLRRRDTNEEEDYDYYQLSLEENCSYSRSWIEEDRDEFVPDGSLTVVCDMWLREESRAGSSDQRKEQQGGFPGHDAAFSSRWKSAKMELTTESPCTHVSLFVPNIFKVLDEMGDSRTSPEFRFAGDAYCFRFEANGNTADTEIHLVRVTSNFTENAVYYRVGYGNTWLLTYTTKSISLVGNVGFCVSRSKLEEEGNGYVYKGGLYLVLFLRLGEQSSPGAGTSDAALKRTGLTGIHKLQSDYRQILQKGTESDACVVVRGKEFPVHRVVLRARSTVFDAMFGHDTAEKESGRVVVDDLDPDCFGVFLEYLYTGDVQDKLSDDNTFGLYRAADKYDVATLKSECLEHIRRNLSVDSFSDVLTLALRHCEEDLLQQSIQFFKNNLQRIIITAKWQQFALDNGTTANELFIKALVPESTSSHH